MVHGSLPVLELCWPRLVKTLPRARAEGSPLRWFFCCVGDAARARAVAVCDCIPRLRPTCRDEHYSGCPHRAWGSYGAGVAHRCSKFLDYLDLLGIPRLNSWTVQPPNQIGPIAVSPDSGHHTYSTCVGPGAHSFVTSPHGEQQNPPCMRDRPAVLNSMARRRWNDHCARREWQGVASNIHNISTSVHSSCVQHFCGHRR